jgi:hypothetical protein
VIKKHKKGYLSLLDGKTNYLFEKPSIRPPDIYKIKLYDRKIEQSINKMRGGSTEDSIEINSDAIHKDGESNPPSSDQSISRKFYIDA